MGHLSRAHATGTGTSTYEEPLGDAKPPDQPVLGRF